LSKSNELRETRATMIAKARQIHDTANSANRNLSDEEKGECNSLFEQIDALAADIANSERSEKLDTLEASLRASAGRKVVDPRTETIKTREYDPEEVDLAFRGWLLHSAGADRMATSKQLSLAHEIGMPFNSKCLTVNRALSKASGSVGAYTVPQAFSDTYEREIKYFFPISDAVSTFNTPTGRDFLYPQASDVGNLAAIVSEAGNLAASTVDPAFGQITFKAWKYGRQVVKVSAEVVADSELPLTDIVGSMFAESFGRTFEAAIVSSNAGTSAPEGLLHSVSAAVNLASGNSMTVQKLMALETSVDIAYRRSPGCAWVMHDVTWGAIRQLATTAGAPIFQTDLQNGVAPRLFGYPVHVSNQLTSISAATDNEPLVIFGDLSRYKLRRIGQNTGLIVLNELYAANGQIGLTMLERMDGRYVGYTGCVKTLNAYDAP
jgi:HK97 family phage major capsid protein